jgi:hypothetical protein
MKFEHCHRKWIAIHKKRCGNVLSAVKERFEKDHIDPWVEGQITLICHATFTRLQRLKHCLGDVIVFIDEIPAAEKCLTDNLPETHGLLTSKIDIILQGPIYGRVEVTDRKGLEADGQKQKSRRFMG